MTETKLLIGSLSSDLYRIANFAGRGSYPAANRFFQEAKKWSAELAHTNTKAHIQKIIIDINTDTSGVDSLEKAEKFLMYSVLLQNYALHSLN